MVLKIVEGDEPKIEKEPEKVTVEMKGVLHVKDTEAGEAETGNDEN